MSYPSPMIPPIYLSRRALVVAATSLQEVSTVEPRETETSVSGRDRLVSKPPGKLVSSKWSIDPNEVMSSTIEHRVWTYGGMSVMGGLFFQAVSAANDLGPEGWVTISISALAAYVLADLGTGIYHWSVDNYGDGSTPLVGKQIAAFQGHHQKPWTITRREFANNLHQVFKPASFPSLIFLVFSPWTSISWNAFSSTFLFLICMSQQFHAWAHMKKSELPEQCKNWYRA